MVNSVYMDLEQTMESLKYTTAVDGALSVTTDGTQKKVSLPVNKWALLHMSPITLVTESPMIFGWII